MGTTAGIDNRELIDGSKFVNGILLGLQFSHPKNPNTADAVRVANGLGKVFSCLVAVKAKYV